MKTSAELADFAPVEPRCRICRDPDLRRLVNHLLDWRGVPIILGHGKTHRVTYAEIRGQRHRGQGLNAKPTMVAAGS